MKSLFVLLLLSLSIVNVSGQNVSGNIAIPDTSKKIKVVEASCGECQFKLAGKGCHLAVRIDGKSYFVDGTSIDEHGDAHAADGFCEAIKKAEVQGEIVNNRFKATYFKLVKKDSKKEEKPE